jgi:hypothetical protein
MDGFLLIPTAGYDLSRISSLVRAVCVYLLALSVSFKYAVAAPFSMEV